MVRPKKYLGQHFLKDVRIAGRIVGSLQADKAGSPVLEIGPGTGVLTEKLLERDLDLRLIEIDKESVLYLKRRFPDLETKIIEGDFLKLDLFSLFKSPFYIIGNFPYNISSQIFFKILEFPDQVQQVVCMLQKEVADRIAAGPGSKTYGILSVLLQTWYRIEMLFKVSPGVFQPPPKVMSAVIRFTRNQRTKLECDEQLFQQIVKQSFQKRRKTLRNALKHLNLPDAVIKLDIMNKRPEQLSVADYIFLTSSIEHGKGIRRI